MLAREMLLLGLDIGARSYRMKMNLELKNIRVEDKPVEDEVWRFKTPLGVQVGEFKNGKLKFVFKEYSPQNQSSKIEDFEI